MERKGTERVEKVRALVFQEKEDKDRESQHQKYLRVKECTDVYKSRFALFKGK